MQSSTEEPYWGEKFLYTLSSYALVLIPIWLVVYATRHEIFPKSIRESEFIRWFVEGYDNQPQGSEKPSKEETLETGKEHKIVKDSPDASNQKSLSPWKFAWCLLGLQISYLLWGLLQERVMTSRYEVKSWKEWLEGEEDKFSPVDQVPINSNSSLAQSSLLTNQMTMSPVVETITFGDSQFLVFVNRMVAFIISMIVILGEHLRAQSSRDSEVDIDVEAKSADIKTSDDTEKKKPMVPYYEYIYCSLSNVLSSWCQYEALKYVSFPTQALSKTCKVIPVMIVSSLVLRKKYHIVDYICASMLSIGLFMFILFQPDEHGIQPANSIHDVSATNYSITDDSVERKSINGDFDSAGNLWGSSLVNGLIILGLYLVFDSFTSNWQQSLFSRYSVTNWQMMGATSIYSIALTLTSLQQLGNLRPDIKLLSASPDLLLDCLLTSITSSIGQLFVFITIKQFGSVVFAVIMTLRQLFAILLSCAVYGHELSLGSCTGLLLVFSAIGYQLWRKSLGPALPPPVSPPTMECKATDPSGA